MNDFTDVFRKSLVLSVLCALFATCFLATAGNTFAQITTQADFSAKPTSGCAPLQVTFTDQSTLASSWTWTFPGGSPSSAKGQGPHQVTYQAAGQYSVRLDVAGQTGQDTEIKNNYIQVNDCSCTADFLADKTTACAGDVILFTDQSVNAQKWLWSFPGGSPAGSSSQGPVQVTYDKAGTYTVELEIWCQNGTDKETKSSYIQIQDCSPTANFSVTPQSGCAPLFVTYSDLSSDATSWNWTFSGGSPSSASGEGPHTVVYHNAGSYDAKLVVVNAYGQDTETRTGVVTASTCYDFGDATGPLLTLAQDDGARHILDPGVYLGESIDADDDGIPSEDGMGEARDNNDDDDGISFAGEWKIGNTVTMHVNASVDGYLGVWWAPVKPDAKLDVLEPFPYKKLPLTAVLKGDNTIDVEVKESEFASGAYTVRFRFSTDNNFEHYGPAPDGEVEDYVIEVTDDLELPYEYGDAPEGAVAYLWTGVEGAFPTCKDSGPAGFVRHGSAGSMYLGHEVDYEVDGNGGECPEFTGKYDSDEGLNEPREGIRIYRDVGLLSPINYTIRGEAGEEHYWPYSIYGKRRGVLGNNCELAAWGRNIDVEFHVDGDADGFVNVLIDWNQDGSWGGYEICPDVPDGYVREHVLHNFRIPAGTGRGILSDLEPPDFLIGLEPGYAWMRITISDSPVEADWDGSGEFSDGETEDYLICLSFSLFHDHGDAPEGVLAYPSLGVMGEFPTCRLLGEDFSYIRHSHTLNRRIGPTIDLEYDGNAGLCPVFNLKYDFDESYDNEALVESSRDAGIEKIVPYTILGGPEFEFVQAFIAEGDEGDRNRSLGSAAGWAEWGTNLDLNFWIHGEAEEAFINVLIDWNQDGEWGGLVDGPGLSAPVPERVLSDVRVSGRGMFRLSSLGLPRFQIGPNAGYVWTRFTITDRAFGPDWTGSGLFADGETEDYLFRISERSMLFDWGDAPLPYPTTNELNGARHRIDASMYLGTGVDAEEDGLPDPDALGDDNIGNDGASGILLLKPASPGDTAHVKVLASMGGYLSIWIDLDQDSIWENEEAILNQQVGSGNNELWIPIPADAGSGRTFARFRYSGNRMDSPYDEVDGGEVEDMVFEIPAPSFTWEFGDAPEGVQAYPYLPRTGNFPTCKSFDIEGSLERDPAGYIQHGNLGQLYWGPAVDYETDGNGGYCPVFGEAQYDADEIDEDGDAGIRNQIVYSIEGEPGSLFIKYQVDDLASPLLVCELVEWGRDIDMEYHVLSPEGAYVNVLFDWDRNGQWGGEAHICSGSGRPEHVLKNFRIDGISEGNLSDLEPPDFSCGGGTGYVWARFTITDIPVPDEWDGSGEFMDGETEDYLLYISSELSKEMGDAPDDGALAYPSLGVFGQFPTCSSEIPGSAGRTPAVWHMGTGGRTALHFSTEMPSFESNGNRGYCPDFAPGLYNMDDDIGLFITQPYTITGPAGGETVEPEREDIDFTRSSLGTANQMARWGTNIDIGYQNGLFDSAYVNVLIDWNQDGEWGGLVPCPVVGDTAREHVLNNLKMPPGGAGTLRRVGSIPDFRIGPNYGYVWARFTISEKPVEDDWNGSEIFDEGETQDYLLRVRRYFPGFDCGDLPIPFHTHLVDSGAIHRIDHRTFLGDTVDAEPDGLPTPDANGDDQNGKDDDDGFVWPNYLEPGKQVTVEVTASTDGILNGWIDFDRDSSFADPSEHVLSDMQLEGGTSSVTLTIPGSAKSGITFARFRFSDESGLSYMGPVLHGEQADSSSIPIGEVEDYRLWIVSSEELKDYGDAPEGAPAYPSLGVLGQFPTCRSGPSGFIEHGLMGTLYFGKYVDYEPDGNGGNCPDFTPNKYDQDERLGPDAGYWYPGFAYTIRGDAGSEKVVSTYLHKYHYAIGHVCEEAAWGEDLDMVLKVTGPGRGYVNVLADWNRDGKWGGEAGCLGGAGAPEHILVNFPVTGSDTLLSQFAPPSFRIGSDSGYVWTRFTISEAPVTLPWKGEGTFDDGETEDYLLKVYGPDEVYDYGDAPEGVLAYPSTGTIGTFPTCKSLGSAGFIRHGARGTLYFGTIAPDLESDGNAGYGFACCPVGYDMDSENMFIRNHWYTITGNPGSETVIRSPRSTGIRPENIGAPCEVLDWGDSFDLSIANTSGDSAFVNMLIDWNRDGSWGGISDCPDGVDVPEHVLINHKVPAGLDPLADGDWSRLRVSAYGPDPFRVGPDSGYVWARCTITERPVPSPWDGSGSFEDGETMDVLLRVGGEPTSAVSESEIAAIPEKFALAQNYPNPFNPTTEIEFSLPKPVFVHLAIYNLRGQQIRLLVNESKQAGFHRIRWDAKNTSGIQVPAGMYLYSIDAGSFTDTKKLILLK